MLLDKLTITKPIPVYYLNGEHRWRSGCTLKPGEVCHVIDAVTDERGSCLVVRLYGVVYLIDCNDLE